MPDWEHISFYTDTKLFSLKTTFKGKKNLANVKSLVFQEDQQEYSIYRVWQK